MKILYFASTLQKAGPTSQLYYIIANLAKDITPVLVTFSPEPAQSRLEDFRALGVKHYQLDLSRLAGIFFAKNILKQIVNKEQPDAIHSQGYRGDMLASSFANYMPVVCTVRNFPQLDFSMTYGRILGGFMAYRQIKALNKVSKVCAVSVAVKGNLEKCYSLPNVISVLNGVDMQKFYNVGTSQKALIRRKYDIEENSRVWVTSLGKDTRKNSLTVAVAFSRFLSQHPDDTLIFIGDGEQRDECLRASAGSPQFKFFGRVNNVFDYLQMADYFVSASRAEGMPNAVLEAMACGLPSVLSNIAPHKEINVLNPDGCVLFETESSDDLCEKLVDVVKANRDHMSGATSEVVNKYFASESMSSNYQQIYRDLVQ